MATNVVAPSIRTRITTLLKCRHPIILPGMSWISTPKLVAAVSNAGGVGILATGPLNADETRRSIDEIRKLTDRPFGIGATLLMPGSEDNARVALEEEVPIVNVSLGRADWIVDAVHGYGGVVLSTVTNAKHADAAIRGGADALLVTGHEAAAHGGDVVSSVLVPSLSDRFPDIPIIAAGGYVDGRGLYSALSLGADAVAMGSRFAVTVESPLAQGAKDAILSGDEDDTVYGKNFDGIPARVLRTISSTRRMKQRPSVPAIVYRAFQAAREMNIPLWKVVPGLITQYDKMFMVAQFGAASTALKKATINGDMENGVQFVGQGQGMIRDIPTVDALFRRIMKQAFDVSKRQNNKFVYHTEEENENHDVVITNNIDNSKISQDDQNLTNNSNNAARVA